MKKSLKKILFTILTVFAVFFVVACGNKEDAKINKEEVLQKNVEATNSIKSGNKLVTAKVEIKGGQTIEYTFDISLIMPSNITSEIQDKHSVVYHLLCEMLEADRWEI